MKTFHSFLYTGDSSAARRFRLTFQALRRSVKYAWRVDAFNDRGVTFDNTITEK